MITLPNQKPPVGAVLNRSHPLAKGLVGCWLMNERGGATAFDVSGNRRNVTIGNEAYFTSRGLYCDGTNDYAYINYGLAAFPITLVVYGVHTSGQGSLMLSSSWSSQASNYWIGISTANTNVSQIQSRSSGTTTTVGTKSVNDGYPHMIVGVFTSNSLRRLYTDGVFEAESTVESLSGVASHDRIGFSAIIRSSILYYESQPMIFAMIYGRSLAASEILSLYQSPYAMFQRDRAVIWKAPAAGATFKPAWAINCNRLIGSGLYV
jgi:hypothetical protein